MVYSQPGASRHVHLDRVPAGQSSNVQPHDGYRPKARRQPNLYDALTAYREGKSAACMSHPEWLLEWVRGHETRAFTITGVGLTYNT